MRNTNTSSLDRVINEEIGKALLNLAKRSNKKIDPSHIDFVGRAEERFQKRIANSQKIVNDNIEREKREMAMPFPAPKFTEPVQQPSFSTNQFGEPVFTPRETQNCRVVTTDEVEVPVIDYDSKWFKMRKKLFENSTGTSYVFKCYWDQVLESLKKLYPDSGIVKFIEIRQDTIILNKKQLSLSRILGGEYEIELVDMLDIVSLLTRYKFVKILNLDGVAMSKTRMDYGSIDVGIKDYFEKAPNLQQVGLISIGESKPKHILYREPFLANANKALENARGDLGKEELKEKISLFSASKIPKFGKISPGMISRGAIRARNFGGKLGSQFEEQLLREKTNWGATLKYGLFGLASGVVGVASGAVGKVVDGAGTLFNLFKDD